MLSAAGQNPRRKAKRAAQYNLERGAEKGRFDVFILNACDRPKLYEYNEDGDDSGGSVN
jgi:hypothetical protein